jgi:hypothetical protein
LRACHEFVHHNSNARPFFFGFHNESFNWISQINSLGIVRKDIHGNAADSAGNIDTETGWNLVICDVKIDQVLTESIVSVAERFIDIEHPNVRCRLS